MNVVCFLENYQVGFSFFFKYNACLITVFYIKIKLCQ